MSEAEQRAELEATLAARRELGPAHDDDLVAGFVDRIGREIDRRVDERLAKQLPQRRSSSRIHPANLALSIPIIAVAGGIGHLAGLITAFIALVVLFVWDDLRR